MEDENLIAAWTKAAKLGSEVEEQTPEVFCSNEEPRRGLEPLQIDLIEDRFEYLIGKAHVSIVNNHEPLGAPANRISWCELQRACHERFYAPDGGNNAHPS